MSSNEAGLLDAVAFVTGGQQEGAIPQGFETHWRRTVHGREIKYQSIGPYVGQANDQHRDSRHVRIGVTITSRLSIQEARTEKALATRPRPVEPISSLSPT